MKTNSSAASADISAPATVNQEDFRVGKFYEAINQYASEQRQKINQEILDYKQKELEKATDQVLQEAYEMIQKEMANMTSSIAREMAKKELEGRQALLKRRKAITEEVFKSAAKKLLDYANGSEYPEYLKKCALKMKPLFTVGDTVIYLREEDKKYEDLLEPLLGRCIFRIDRKIRLGGFWAESNTQGIVADETFDSLLENQRKWFAENTNMEIV